MLRSFLNVLLVLASTLLGRRRGTIGAGAPTRLRMPERDREPFAARDAIPPRPVLPDNFTTSPQPGLDDHAARADRLPLRDDWGNNAISGLASTNQDASPFDNENSRRSADSLAGDGDSETARDTTSTLPPSSISAAGLDVLHDSQTVSGAGEVGHPAISDIATPGDPVSEADSEPPSDTEPLAPQSEPVIEIYALDASGDPSAAEFGSGDAKGDNEQTLGEPQEAQSTDPSSEPEPRTALRSPEGLDTMIGSGNEVPLSDVTEDIQPATTETRESETACRRPPIRPAAKYRPQLGQAVRTLPRAPSSAPSGGQQAMEADFLLSFHPGDWGLDIAALLRRPAGSPEQLEISDGGKAVALERIDDSLFEPLPISDLASSLAKGFAAETASGPRLRWTRTGRRLHVFSERSGVPGFATVPRVIIGQENAALCTTEFAAAMLEQIIATGAPQPSEIEGPGLPAGWVCWRGIRPAHPHQPAGDDELLNALDPRADAAIEFAGGMTVARGQWIEGYPPSVRIVGTGPAPGEVTINGTPAAVGADSGWTAPGWDAEGVHQVEYLGIRRSYSIVRVATSWPWWAAHGSSGIELAGALGSAFGRQPPLILADPTLWLVGARPGEICRAIHHPGTSGVYAAPVFEPVWAIARKSSRQRPQPTLIGVAVPPQPAVLGTPAASIRTWSQIIRNAGPTGSSHDRMEAAVWRQFVAAARSVRRHRR